MSKLREIWFDKIVSPQRIRLFAILSLITQILIVVTGGAVRLTASGLGCPTWPKCTEDSLITTPEMGFHGIIEFGNRLLTFVLLIVALLTFISALRQHPNRPKLIRPFLVFALAVVLLIISLVVAEVTKLSSLAVILLAASGAFVLGAAIWFLLSAKHPQRHYVIPAFGLGFGIIFQAVLGGITVLTELNPWIVGAHFLVSAILISIASLLLWRVRKPLASNVSALTERLRWPILIVGAITIVVGVLVTGAGPHAGDIDTPRNGLDIEIWQHYHSYPAYLMTAMVFLVLLSQLAVDRNKKFSPLTKTVLWLFLVALAQALVGIVQARLGVPALLVGIHMLGAAVVTWLLSTFFIASRKS